MTLGSNSVDKAIGRKKLIQFRIDRDVERMLERVLKVNKVSRLNMSKQYRAFFMDGLLRADRKT